MSIAATVRRANRILDKGIRFAEEMKTLCMEAGMLDDELTAAIERVFQACEFSAKNGRPTPSKKVYVSHVNQAFNVEIQIDLFFPTVRGIKHTIMNLTDTGTNFTEIALCETRLAQTIETVCIFRHGACGIYACIPIALTRLLSHESSKPRITCQVRGCALYSALERTYALGNTLN